jgi:hypothetical protein
MTLAIAYSLSLSAAVLFASDLMRVDVVTRILLLLRA